MADYSSAVIYIITTGDCIYVGSTVDFKKRKIDHKSNVNIYNNKLYKNIRANNCDWNMEIYKSFPCENFIELRQEEDRIMMELNANLNSQRAYRSEEDKKKYMKIWCENNKEELSAKDKIWRENNKEELSAKKKIYDDKNRDKINAKRREWRENNRDRIHAIDKLWREKNRDKLKAKISARNCKIITCECGCDVSRGGIASHRKTKKHLNLMESLDKLV